MKNIFIATVFDKAEGRRRIVSKPSSDFTYLRKQISNICGKDPSNYRDPKIKLQLNLEKS